MISMNEKIQRNEPGKNRPTDQGKPRWLLHFHGGHGYYFGLPIAIKIGCKT
jgi:hypothetical protein